MNISVREKLISVKYIIFSTSIQPKQNADLPWLKMHDSVSVYLAYLVKYQSLLKPWAHKFQFQL